VNHTTFAVDMQEELRPILLRRMKEDVENLPEKEEVVVWVQLTHQQRAYYKALYSNQVSPSGCTAMQTLPSAYILSSCLCRKSVGVLVN